MNYLSNIPTIITHTDNVYNIQYQIDNHTGSCVYNKYKPLSRFQQGDIIQMTECNMVDIISYLNEKSPLNDGDLINLQMEIRTDSLTRLKNYISSGSLSHI